MGTLSKSLGTDVNSPVSAVAPSSKFFQEELMPSMQQMQTALGTEEKFKKEKSVKEAQQQADILGKDVILAEEENKKLREDPTRAKYQAAISQKESAAYIPDQENPERLATILALTNLMGVAIGRGGKANAQTALAAQNGMLEGYQKGRADIIKQQKDIFDETQKKLDKTIDDLHRGMQDAAILYAKDKEAGHQKAMLTMAANQASFMKDFYDKNGMGQTYEMSKQIYDMKNKKHAEMQKEEDKMILAAERAEERQRAQSYREEMLSLQRERLEKKGAAGADVPKDKETRNEHRFRFEAMQNVEDVLNDLQKPEVRKLIGPENNYMPDVILSLQKGYPELAQKLARFQAEEFKTGGKSLTSSEQRILGPIYNWRSLTADSLEDNLKEANRVMNREQRILESAYPGLQNFSNRYQGAVGSGPTQTPKETSKGLDQPVIDTSKSNVIPAEVASFLKDKPEGSGTKSGNKIYRVRNGVVQESEK
jgi:hypothetical protein